jgi:hypothetical protein
VKKKKTGPTVPGAADLIDMGGEVLHVIARTREVARSRVLRDMTIAETLCGRAHILGARIPLSDGMPVCKRCIAGARVALRNNRSREFSNRQKAILRGVAAI